MKHIIPYTTFQEAIEAFDNGGKLFNLFSHAHDGVVSSAELEQAAGIANNKQAMILFLVLSISRLDNRSREKILARLDSHLFEIYEKYRPIHMSHEQVIEHGKPGICATIVGTLKKITTTDNLTGTIMVPLVVGSETSFTMVPIEDSYEVYELSSEYTDKIVWVAHQKEKVALPERKLRIGGILTSLSQVEPSDQISNVFLEAQYYLEED